MKSIKDFWQGLWRTKSIRARRTLKILLRNPAQGIRLIQFRGAVQKRAWEAARILMHKLGPCCIQMRDHRTLAELFLAAARFGEDNLATRWAVIHGEMVGWINKSTWQGQDLSRAHIQIFFKESQRDGVSSGMNLAGWAEAVRQRANVCELFVDSRLVPLFKRTLPDMTITAWTPDLEPADRALKANKLTLKNGLGVHMENIRSLFKPLVPDPIQRAELWQRYHKVPNQPVVGVSWFSGQDDKDIPPLDLYFHLAKAMPEALFLDLQPMNSSTRSLGIESTPSNFISDPSIDQYENLETFAAQLSALDLVISVSNTGAHLAASVGVKTIVLRDDRFTRGWPVVGHSTPWYPSVFVLGKEGRSWPQVFDELKKLIRDMLT